MILDGEGAQEKRFRGKGEGGRDKKRKILICTPIQEVQLKWLLGSTVNNMTSGDQWSVRQRGVMLVEWAKNTRHKTAPCVVLVLICSYTEENTEPCYNICKKDRSWWWNASTGSIDLYIITSAINKYTQVAVERGFSKFKMVIAGLTFQLLNLTYNRHCSALCLFSKQLKPHRSAT